MGRDKRCARVGWDGILKSASVTTRPEKRMCSGMSIFEGQLISFPRLRETEARFHATFRISIQQRCWGGVPYIRLEDHNEQLSEQNRILGNNKAAEITMLSQSHEPWRPLLSIIVGLAPDPIIVLSFIRSGP